jgi:hypothetical protein
VLLGGLSLVEGQLDARDAVVAEQGLDLLLHWLLPGASAAPAEQHDAIARGLGLERSVLRRKRAAAQPHDRVHEVCGVEVGPLVGEAEVRFDDSAADGFEVHRSAVVAEVLSDEAMQIKEELLAALHVDVPAIKRAFR